MANLSNIKWVTLNVVAGDKAVRFGTRTTETYNGTEKLNNGKKVMSKSGSALFVFKGETNGTPYHFEKWIHTWNKEVGLTDVSASYNMKETEIFDNYTKQI